MPDPERAEPGKRGYTIMLGRPVGGEAYERRLPLAKASGERASLFAVLAAATLYAVIFGAVCHCLFRDYRYGDFDLAIDAQATWNVLHGSAMSSIHGIPFLGNHMRLILFIIAPVYALFPSPLTLLHLQTVALAAAAVFLYLLARRHLPCRWAAALALVYLLYPPLISMNLYEFHPVALTVLFFTCMLHAYGAGRFAWFLATYLLALSCQENIGLLGAAFGVYAIVDGRRGRWVLWPIAIGAAHFLVCVFVVMPRLNRDTIQFAQLYAHMGASLPEVFFNILRHPLKAAAHMLTPPKLGFLGALLSPVGFLSLLGPSGLIPAVPALVQRLLSARPSEASVAYHYQAEFIPFVFYSSVLGLKRLLAVRHRTARLVAATILCAAPLLSLAASGVLPRIGAALRPGPEVRAARPIKDAFVDGIRAADAVVATFDFQPRLSNRRSLFSPHHIYTGAYTLSGTPYPTPEADVVLLTTDDRLTFGPAGFYSSTGYRRLQEFLDPAQWALTDQLAGVLTFRKRDAERRLPPPWAYGDVPGEANRNVANLSEGAPIELVAFQSVPDGDEPIVTLVLYWDKPAPSKADVEATITLHGDSGPPREVHVVPGHRIWPPQSWEPGRTVVDRHRFPQTPAFARVSRIDVRLVPAGARSASNR